jgi:signal transduction histidine kinase
VLGDRYPHLILQGPPASRSLAIDPAAIAAVEHEAAKRRRMFVAEGVTLLALLLAATTVLILAVRRERDFKRARELFLAGATHEFKTPLASLRLFTETLQREDLDPDTRPRIHKSMLKDVARLEGMVEKILAVGREEDLGQAENEAFDLAEVAAEVLESLAPLFAARGVKVESSLAPAAKVFGSRAALAVALRNLLQNAAVHCPPPVRVAVTLRSGEGRHRLAVADDGPGIPRRERRRIFESFARGESGAGGLARRPGGSGLGLYLVERNAGLLGGRVELDSEEGRGSTFTLVLPAHEEDA